MGGSGSLRLGTIFGISVQLHWSAGIIALLLGANLAAAVGWPAALVGVLAFLASILAHELAHALVARRFGVGTESIQLWALGGVARLDRAAPTARADGWIAAAGPIASVAAGAVAIVAWWSLGAGSGGSIVAMLGWIGAINALLALFNLLPGAPLDGGRILRAVRWAVHGDRHRASHEAGRAGVILGWTIAGVGFGLILSDHSGIWLIVTGLFITMNARVEIEAALAARRLAGVTVRDLTWFGVAEAGVDMDADSMLWQRQRLGDAGGVAVTHDGTLQGFVLEDQLWAVPEADRPWVLLTQLMVPAERVARARLDDELADVLPGLDPRRPLVTVWEGDRLIGMVPPRRLLERLRQAGV